MKPLQYTLAGLIVLAGLLITATASAYTPAEGLAARGDAPVCDFGYGLSRWGYGSARVSYPCGLDSEAPAITLTGGYTNVKEQMYWLADHLTSHGYIVISITPYNIFGTPTVWKHAHRAGIRELLAQDGTWWSPIRNRVDRDKLGVMGFSMGGGGALLAAGELGDSIRSVTALAPYVEDERPFYANISANAQVIGGSWDQTSRASAVASYYESLPADIPRNLSIMRYMTHIDWVGFPSSLKNRAKIMITAWLNRHLDGEKKYEAWFDGRIHDRHLAEDWFTRFDYQQ